MTTTTPRWPPAPTIRPDLPPVIDVQAPLMCEPWCRDHDDISTQCDAEHPVICCSATAGDLYITSNNNGEYTLMHDDGRDAQYPLQPHTAHALAELFNTTSERLAV